ncbi:MAG: hypothetical protein IKY22_02080 [Bacteroidales bacterium]|nr:hypothetical protein [Bacteroidales bacterium]
MELSKLIDSYIEHGFGSMNKNDFEVFIFSYLVKEHAVYKDKSNFELSILLRIPESKVKRLRYESDLKYTSKDDNNDGLKNRLNKVLSKANLKFKDKQQIQFVIEDVYLRSYLDDYLKKKGYFSDTSFNREIVIINLDTLSYLMENILDKEVANVLETATKQMGRKLKFRELLEKITSDGSSTLIDLSINGILLLIKSNLW